MEMENALLLELCFQWGSVVQALLLTRNLLTHVVSVILRSNALSSILRSVPMEVCASVLVGHNRVRI